MDLDPKDPDPPAALARLYIAQGKKAEAEAFLKQVKPRFPDNSTGYRMLGDFYFATGDLDKATAEYGSIYHDHPKDLQVEKNYIQLLILKNRLDDASKLNDAILAGNANETDALIYRGQIQIRGGHPSDAAQTLQTALKNDPDNGVAHYHLGLALDQMGNPERAVEEFRSAVRLRPDLIEAQRALATAAMRKGDMETLEQTATRSSVCSPPRPTVTPCGRSRKSIASNSPPPSKTYKKRSTLLRKVRPATSSWEISSWSKSNTAKPAKLIRKRLTAIPTPTTPSAA